MHRRQLFPMSKTTKSRARAAQTSTVDALLEALAGVKPDARKGLQADPVWGNSDVLADQWRAQFPGVNIDGYALVIRMRRIAMLIDEISIAECEKAGLKLNEMLLLLALRRLGEPYCLRPTDITRMHSVTSGTVTYRIDQLTKQDLAERIADPDDRRGYLIKLTPRGLSIINKLILRFTETFNRDLAPMAATPGALTVFEESLRAFERCITSIE